MNGQMLIMNNSSFARSSNPVSALLKFLDVCELPGADELREAILVDEQFSITINSVEYTREFCDECGAKPGFHDKDCSRNALNAGLCSICGGAEWTHSVRDHDFAAQAQDGCGNKETT